MGYYDIDQNLLNRLNSGSAGSGGAPRVNLPSPRPTPTPRAVKTTGNVAQRAQETGQSFVSDALSLPFKAAGKALDVLDFPGRVLRRGILGEESTVDFLKKRGVNPTLATVGGIAGDIILDPLNLLLPGAGLLSKADDAAKVARIAGKAAKIDDIQDITKSLTPVLGLADTPVDDLLRTQIRGGIQRRAAGFGARGVTVRRATEVAEQLAGGKKFATLNTQELSKLSELVERGTGVRSVRVGGEIVDDGLEAGRQLDLFGDVADIGEVTETARTVSGNLVRIPRYMEQPLELFRQSAKIQDDVGFISSTFKPFWRTVEDIDPTGTIKRSVYEPIEKAFVRMTRDRTKLNKTINGLVKNFDKAARVRIFRILDNANDASEMQALLNNADEVARIGLQGATRKELEAAVNLRGQLNSLLGEANKARVAIGKEPIPPIRNYISHIIDTRVTDAMKQFGKVDENIVYWLDREIMPLIDEGIILQLQRNPNFLKRSPNALPLKTEDVAEVMKAYTGAILKDIHLLKPVEEVKGAIRLLPRDMQRLTRDFLNHGVLSRTMKIDRTLSNTLRSVLKGISGGRINPQGNLFGRAASKVTKATFRGGLAFNVRSAFQNISQRALTLTELGVDDFARGWAHMKNPTALDKRFIAESSVLADRIGEADALANVGVGRVERMLQKADDLGLFFFNRVEQGNVMQAFLGAANKEYRASKSIKKAVEAGDRAAKVTQFSYRRIDLPPAMWSGFGRLLLQFQTFPINFGFYVKEISKQPDKAARFLASVNLTNNLFENTLGYSPFDPKEMFTRGTGTGLRSIPLSPAAQLGATGLQLGATTFAGDEAQAERAQKLFERQLPVLFPAGIALQRTARVASGEESPLSLLGVRPRRDTSSNRSSGSQSRQLLPRL